MLRTRPDICEALAMLPGKQCIPGWLVAVVNDVDEDLDQVEADLDDAIGFDSDPSAHV